MPYVSVKQRFLLFVTAALLFGLIPAVHAEGLSGLKDSLDKGKIDLTLEEQTKQQADIPDMPQSSTVTNKKTTKLQNFLKSAHKMNIIQKGNISKQMKVQPFNSPKDVDKYIMQIKNSNAYKECNLKKMSLKEALLKFLKKPKNKLKRIEEKILPVKLQDEQQQTKAASPWISPLPSSFPPATKDTNELEAISNVINFHDIIKDPEFYNDSVTNLIAKMVQIENILTQAYNENSEYPYICAMLKFYCTEMRVNILGYFDASYTAEKRFDQIYETYYTNMTDNECCREILDLALNRKQDIVLFINKEMSKRISEADTYIDNVKNYLKEMTTTVYPSEEKAPSKDWIEYVYSEVTSSYQAIISANIQKGDYVEARRKLIEMEKYYSEIPSKFKVKYWEDVFNPAAQKYEKAEQSKTYDIKKHTQQYFAVIKSYVSNGGDYSEIDEKSSENVLKDINFYIDKVKAYVPSTDEECSPETLKYFQEQIDNKFSSSETSDHYYSQKRNITKMYFTRKENKELDSQDIPNPLDSLMLRCMTDSKGPLYPFKQDVASAMSSRKKTLNLKKDWFDNGNYYAVFQPNETDNPKDDVKNLINNETNAFKESIACFRGEEELSSPPSIYNSNLMKNQMGRSDFSSDLIASDKAFKNSIDFLKSAGIEYISASKNSIATKAIIRNQADWFVITGHGNPTTGSVGESEKFKNPIIINPSDLIKSDGTSEYKEDVEVLIIGTCGVLNTTDNIKSWYKVLPSGIILGYRKNVYPPVINNAIFELGTCESTQLNTYAKIGLMWQQINQNLYTGTFSNVWDHINPLNKQLRFARHYAYIVNDTYYFTEYHWVKYKPYAMKVKIEKLNQLHIPDFKE